MNDEIKKLRKRIDEIDKKIVNLIEDRVEEVKKVGVIKKNLDFDVEDPEREEEILERVSGISRYPDVVRKIFKRIIEECKNEERK